MFVSDRRNYQKKIQSYGLENRVLDLSPDKFPYLSESVPILLVLILCFLAAPRIEFFVTEDHDILVVIYLVRRAGQNGFSLCQSVL